MLLDHLYASERRIATEQDAFRICRATTEEERLAVTSVLTNFFKKTSTGFTNNRYEKELKTRKDWCKWQKNHRDRTPDKSMTVRPMSSRSPSPSPSPSEEETTRSFQPPTEHEVCAFMQSRKIPDAERQAELFIAHHANRKWRLGGGKGPVMVSWRKAVVTWQANIPKFGGGDNCARLAVNGASIGRGPAVEHASPERAQEILQQIERQRAAGRPH